MFNKNMAKKSITTVLGLGMALIAASYSPKIAQADNGLHLGLGIHTNAQVENNNNDHGSDEASVKASGSLNMQNMFDGSVKAAQTTFHAAVKQANTTYRVAVKVAHDKFVAAVKVTTDMSVRIAALKTYMSEKLAAFKTKSASVEAAFQAFINTQFTTNQAPVANAQNVTMHENSSVNITLTGSDPEGSALTYAVVSTTAHGTLSGTAPNMTYTPSTNFTGTDSFTFKVNDGSLDSSLKTVSITVNP